MDWTTTTSDSTSSWNITVSGSDKPIYPIDVYAKKDASNLNNDNIEAWKNKLDLNNKQDKLIPGDNIIIEDNVISAVISNKVNSVNGKEGDVVLDKTDIGLGNVDNTSDLNKPISTATQTALNNKQDNLIPGTNISIINNTISADIPNASANNNGLMSAADKNKLDNIAPGAEVNVQSDWNQSNSTLDSYIKNKPDIKTEDGTTIIGSEWLGWPISISEDPDIGGTKISGSASLEIDDYAENGAKIVLQEEANNKIEISTQDGDNAIYLGHNENYINISTNDGIQINRGILITNDTNQIEIDNGITLENTDGASISLQNGQIDISKNSGEFFTEIEGNKISLQDISSDDEQPELEITSTKIDASYATITGNVIQDTVGNNLTIIANNLSSHIGNTSNPHNVSAAQLGLGNVDNTSDLNKPISTATQAALNQKQNSFIIETITEETDPAFDILGGHIYDIKNPEGEDGIYSLTIDSIPKTWDEIQIWFSSSSSDFSSGVSLPSNIKWFNKITPVFEPGKNYIISIVNEVAVLGEY